MQFTLVIAVIVLLLNRLAGYYIPKNGTKIVDFQTILIKDSRD